MTRSWILPSAPAVPVMGASSGIGEATALRFARERARLGLLARLNRLSPVAADWALARRVPVRLLPALDREETA